MKQQSEELEQQIKSLEQQIKDSEDKNKKIRFNSFFSKSFDILKGGIILCSIPVLACGYVYALFFSDDNRIFQIDKKEYNACTISYIDESGVKTEYETDEAFRHKEHIDTITYFGEWTKSDNNFYKRNVYRYEATSDGMSELIDLLNSSENIEIESINNLVEAHLNTDIEMKEEVTEEEIEKGAYITANYYDKNENRKVISKETEIEKKRDIKFFKIVILTSILFDLAMIFIYRKELKKNALNLITKPKLIDTSDLEKKLKEKKLSLR